MDKINTFGIILDVSEIRHEDKFYSKLKIIDETFNFTLT